MRIIWGDAYLKYDFGKEHPFWPQRGVEFIKTLETRKRKSPSGALKREIEVVEPPRASDDDALLVHTKDYLDRVKKLAREHGYLSIDTPLNPDILEAAYYSVGGTILACKLALQGQLTINTLGGLHHAGIADSGGFCVFNDHAIAIRKLQKEGKIKKAMIYDLDVHAGNGTQEIFYSDPSIFNVSVHQDPTTLYPGTGFAWQRGEGKGEGYNLNIPLPPGTAGQKYLYELDRVLTLYKDYQPDLLILILGVDTYKGDPLAAFELEEKDYQEIGKRFCDFKKLAILFAGGYSQETPQLWLSFLRGLCYDEYQRR